MKPIYLSFTTEDNAGRVYTAIYTGEQEQAVFLSWARFQALAFWAEVNEEERNADS